jgi:hypothetical protein
VGAEVLRFYLPLCFGTGLALYDDKKDTSLGWRNFSPSVLDFRCRRLYLKEGLENDRSKINKREKDNSF